MSSSRSCLDKSDQITIKFLYLIHKVPETDKEAEYIFATVDQMILDYPQLLRHLEPDPEEEEAIRRELKLFELL